jgi:hypothetical protein
MKLNKKLAILNTSILTSEGEYKLKNITLEEARKLIKLRQRRNPLVFLFN